MTATVLLTRPEAQAQRFARQLSAQAGAVPVLIAPMMQIVPDPAAAARALQGAGGLIFTSENGVAACRGHPLPADLTAFCVGDRTAQAARHLGCTVQTGPGDLDGLVALIVAKGWPRAAGPLVHLHGAHVTGNAAQALTAHGLRARGAVVYDQIARPLSRAARALLAGPAPVIVPVFSPRSARLLTPYLDIATAPLGLAAISPAVARALPMQTAHGIRIAESPDAQAMCSTIVAMLGERKFS